MRCLSSIIDGLRCGTIVDGERCDGGGEGEDVVEFVSWGAWDDWDELSVDRSRHALDLTPQGGPPEYYATRNPWAASSAMRRDEWTVEHVAELAQPTDPGTDRRFGALGFLQGGIRLLNNQPRVVLGNVPFNAAATALPDLAAGVAQRYYLCWTARRNPAPSGPSDAVRSELRIINLDTGNDAATTFDLPLAPDTTASFLALGATVIGGLPLTGGDPSIMAATGFFRVRSRYLSIAEMDFDLPYIATLAGNSP